MRQISVLAEAAKSININSLEAKHIPTTIYFRPMGSVEYV